MRMEVADEFQRGVEGLQAHGDLGSVRVLRRSVNFGASESEDAANLLHGGQGQELVVGRPHEEVLPGGQQGEDEVRRVAEHDEALLVVGIFISKIVSPSNKYPSNKLIFNF